MTPAVSRIETVAWIGVGLVLVGLAIPWFLWGVDSVAFGLPIWVWWHVAWMAVAAVSFYAFTRRAWGLGVEGADRG